MLWEIIWRVDVGSVVSDLILSDIFPNTLLLERFILLVWLFLTAASITGLTTTYFWFRSILKLYEQAAQCGRLVSPKTLKFDNKVQTCILYLSIFSFLKAERNS